MPQFLALPGFYRLLFLHIEPVSTIVPVLMIWFYPGAKWFHGELIPDSAVSESLDPRTNMAIWQLGNCYMLLGLLSTFVFRAVRDSLPHNPVAQERILGASLGVLAFADVTHILASFFGLPKTLQLEVWRWNPMTHGNITFVILLFVVRVAWFLGIGRTRYCYGQHLALKKVS